MLYHKEKDLQIYLDDFLKGSVGAFDSIVRLIASDIVNICRRYVGNAEDAKDVCQQVLIRLYDKLRSFRSGSKVSTWIYRVSVNAAIDFLRKRKKTVSLDESIAVNKNNNSSLERIDKKDTDCILRENIEKLPMRQKNVIILKHFEGLTIAQISNVLHCSPSSVKTHLVRALQNLKKKMEASHE